MELGDALRSRRSRREFADVPLSAADRSALLAPASPEVGAGRAYPSAHGLGLVSLDDVGGTISREDVESCVFDSQPWLVLAPCLLAVTVDLRRSLAEFRDQDASGLQARDFAMLEAGCLLQTVLLICAERGLAAVPVAGIRHPELERLLGIEVHVASLVAVGYPPEANA